MISVVLATHNEEANLARCLESVKSFADEIIVVDGESEDKTLAVAKKFGAKIISTTNKLNFHINKQMAMDAATGELVLQLDADEVVDTKLEKFIKQTEKEALAAKKTAQNAKKEYKPTIAAWWIARKNLYLGKFLTKGGQYPDGVIRLYVNGFAFLPHKDVHEQMEVKGATAWADGHLLHYSNPTFAIAVRKWNQYTTFQAEILAKEETLPTGWHAAKYLVWLPLQTWFSIFIRHRGYVDGFPGFVFAVFSGLYHAVVYIKWWEIVTNSHKSTE